MAVAYHICGIFSQTLADAEIFFKRTLDACWFLVAEDLVVVVAVAAAAAAADADVFTLTDATFASAAVVVVVVAQLPCAVLWQNL